MALTHSVCFLFFFHWTEFKSSFEAAFFFSLLQIIETQKGAKVLRLNLADECLMFEFVSVIDL